MRKLLVLLAMSGAAGCGGAAGIPDDYATYEAPEFSFAHPPGWKVERDNTYWGATPPGDSTAVIAVNANDVAFESALAELRDSFKQSALSLADSAGGELEERDLTIDGARETLAYRVRGRVKGEPTTIVTVHVVPEDGKSIIELAAAGPNDELDAEAVAASFKLRG